MKNKKASSAAIIILVLLWLLLGLTNISIAENIPISEEGIKKIGYDKFGLASGIGVAVFNLTTSTDRLQMTGFLTVSNTYNNSVIITCQLITKLSSVDLDENRQPRLHKVISDHIIFEPIPDVSWITLESENARVNPCSVYNFRYTIDIPLDSGYSFDKDTGYLLYINVKKTIENATGTNIGIAYNYKLFLVFTGEQQEQNPAFSMWMLIPVPIVIGGAVFAVYRKKHKKTHTIAPKKTPTVASSSVTVKKTPVDKPTVDSDDMRLRIDRMLERDKQDMFRGGGR